MLHLLNPIYLSIRDDSHQHHLPETLKNEQTHLTLVLVSDSFNDLSLIKRHRLIYDLLKSEYDLDAVTIKLHALSLYLYTPIEWEKEQGKTKKAPACRDGFSH